MRAQHTPGPWMVDDNHGRRYIETHDDIGVCEITPSKEVGKEAFLANSLLIAAAPDLLEACVALLAERSGAAQLSNACLQARDAIAKATGEIK